MGLKLEFCHTGVARERDAEWIAARLNNACAELGTRVERVAESRFLYPARVSSQLSAGSREADYRSPHRAERRPERLREQLRLLKAAKWPPFSTSLK